MFSYISFVVARDTLSHLDDVMTPSRGELQTPRDTRLSKGVVSYTPGSFLKVNNWLFKKPLCILEFVETISYK